MAANQELVELRIEGMDCGNCALGIEKRLSSLGASDVSVDFGSSTAYFRLPPSAELSAYKSEIERLGYRVSLPETFTKEPFFTTIEGKLLLAALFTAPLEAHMLFTWPLLHDPAFQLACAAPVVTIGLVHFGKSAISSLKARYANMDVLIFTGVLAAFAYSLAGTLLDLGPSYLFYETAATIVTVVLAGNVLEKICVRRATSALRELERLHTVSARRLLPSGEVEEMDARRLAPGDEVLVSSGDRVPADGVISWGEASVDESMLTGESLPVDRAVGERVYAGTLLSGGSVKLEVTAIGQQSVLGNIIRLVREAQADKPRLQRIGDKVSGVFVPSVLLVALCTFLFWSFLMGAGFGTALMTSIAVLVIACPCAVGLATPAAVVAGIGRAARHGMLIRGGSTLEDLAKVRTIVFDKTGTLTSGRFELAEIECFGAERSLVRSVIVGLERHSSHPIAKSLLSALSGTEPHPFVSVDEMKGRGISGTDHDGRKFELGSSVLGRKLGGQPGFDIYLSEGERIIAALNLRDELRPEAAAAVKALREKGIRSVLLSGDSESKCKRVAAEAGIQEIFFEKLPEEKLRIVEDLSKDGPVAFVGDGINDAPALAKATVGISLSDASQVAIQSAKVVLLGSEIGRVAEAVGVSDETYRTIKQNLFWAFAYNVCAIPVAAAGLLSPTVAALSMAFSDIIVVGNSLLLKAKPVRRR